MNTAIGGKAKALTRAIKAGYRVPPFIVLTQDSFSANAYVPDTLPSLDALGHEEVAVRSSAQSEDGAQSHAGQFESLLNVTQDTLKDAIAQVRASGDAQHVQDYRAHHSLTDTDLPAVIIQRMIPARFSGVAFGADPVTGVRGRIVISSCAGTAQDLVNGEMDGNTWVVENAALTTRPDSELSDDVVLQVAKMVADLETTFGSPQDVEWAWDGTHLWLIQSRPITTALRDAPTPDSTLRVFDNSNIVESYPGIVSPLTYSFATHVYARVYVALVDLLGVKKDIIQSQKSVFENLLTRIDGRVYYNLGNWYRALSLLPGYELNKANMDTMMGVSEPAPKELGETIDAQRQTHASKARNILSLVPVAVGMLKQTWRLEKTKAAFYQRLNIAIAKKGSIETSNLTELAALWRTIEADLLDKWDAPLINDLLCMIGFGTSRKLAQKWGGDEGLALHGHIMIGQGDIISAEPAQRIRQMGDIVAQEGLQSAPLDTLRTHPKLNPLIDDYIEKFGDRCTEELKLESATLHEDATPILAAIQGAATRQTRDTPTFTPNWENTFKNKPVRRVVLRAFTQWAKARVRDRENLRFERTRIFAMARQVFLKMGREFYARDMLEEARDIFFLTVPEILGTIEGHAMSPNLKALVQMRKNDHAAHTALQDPPERILGRGAAHGPTKRTAQLTRATDASSEKTGTGCCAGKLTAVARVITDPRTQSLNSGEILVARHTDPGWIALFANAGGIVVERGSLLSHSAIVAREMGLPCVVGLKDATHWIKDGDILHLDGTTGRVQKETP